MKCKRKKLKYVIICAAVCLCLVAGIVAVFVYKSQDTEVERYIGTVTPKQIVVKTGENRLTVISEDVSFKKKIKLDEILIYCDKMTCEVTDVIWQDKQTLEIVFDAQGMDIEWNSENIDTISTGHVIIANGDEQVDAVFEASSPVITVKNEVSGSAKKATLEMELENASFGEKISSEDIILDRAFEGMKVTDVERINENNINVTIEGDMKDRDATNGSIYFSGEVSVKPVAMDALLPAYGDIELTYVAAELAQLPSFSTEDTLDISVELIGSEWVSNISVEQISLEGAFKGKEVLEVFCHETDPNRLDVVIGITQDECSGIGEIVFEAGTAEAYHPLLTMVYFDQAGYFGTVENVEYENEGVSITVLASPHGVTLTRKIEAKEIVLGGAFEGGIVTELQQNDDHSLMLTILIPMDLWKSMDNYAGEFMLPVDALDSEYAQISEVDAMIYANPHYFDEHIHLSTESVIGDAMTLGFSNVLQNDVTTLSNTNALDGAKSQSLNWGDLILGKLKSAGLSLLQSIPDKALDLAKGYVGGWVSKGINALLAEIGISTNSTDKTMELLNEMHDELGKINNNIKDVQLEIEKLEAAVKRGMDNLKLDQVDGAVADAALYGHYLSGFDEKVYNDMSKAKAALEKAEAADEEARTRGELAEGEKSQETKAVQKEVDRLMINLIDHCVTVYDNTTYSQGLTLLGNMIAPTRSGSKSILKVYDEVLCEEYVWDSLSYDARVYYYNYIAGTYIMGMSVRNAALLTLANLDQDELNQLRLRYDTEYKKDPSMTFENRDKNFTNLARNAQDELKVRELEMPRIIEQLEKYEPMKIKDGYDRHLPTGIIINKSSVKLVNYTKDKLLISEETLYKEAFNYITTNDSRYKNLHYKCISDNYLLYKRFGTPGIYENTLPMSEYPGLSQEEVNLIMNKSKEASLTDELAKIGAIPKGHEQKSVWLRDVRVVNAFNDKALMTTDMYYKVCVEKNISDFRIYNMVGIHTNNSFFDTAERFWYYINKYGVIQERNYGNGTAWSIQVIEHITPELYEINDRVTAERFMNNTAVTSLDLPNTVTTIGTAAFKGCTSLKNVNLSSALTSIGDSAFEGCKEIKSITLPDGLKVIGKDAFKGCTGLTKVVIPASVTRIDEGAFYGCTGLKEVVFKDGGEYVIIGEKAFTDSGLETLHFNAGLSDIATNAISWENIRNLTIVANSANDISVDGSDAGLTMEDMKGLATLNTLTLGKSGGSIDDTWKVLLSNYDGLTIERLNITDGVTAIADGAFEGLQINSLNLPNSIESIGTSAFKDCGAVIVGDNLPSALEKIGNSAFKGCVGYNCNIMVPEGVTELPDSAFEGCTGITGVTFHTGIKSVGNKAFSGCSYLKEVVFEEGGKNIAIGVEAFADTALSKLILSSGVKLIGENAISGKNLKELTIAANSTKEITVAGSKDGLTSDVIPEISKLNTITIGGNSGVLDNTWKSFLSGYNNLTIDNLIISDGVREIENGTFEGLKIDNVKLADSIEIVGASAFKGSGAVIDIHLTSELNTIGDEAFYNCKTVHVQLKNKEIISIGKNAFYGCPIEEVILESETSIYIADGAFGNNTAKHEHIEVTQYVLDGKIDYLGKGAISTIVGSQDSEETAVVQIYDPYITISEEMFTNPKYILLKAYDVCVDKKLHNSFYGFTPMIDSERILAIECVSGSGIYEKQMHLYYNGEGEASLKLKIKEDVPWLTLSRQELIVVGGRFQELVVSVDTDVPKTGLYRITMLVTDKNDTVLSEIMLVVFVDPPREKETGTEFDF